MDDYETYTVGEYFDPQPEDQLRPYKTVSAAIEAASHRSDCYPKSIIAVWDSEDRVVYIFINGDQFIPV